ncbi:Superoxide dismutase [Cu-Zn] precursor [Rhodobacteraceae bacterium THAF1]|uniref:superoxide dismutase family protein n=1 Tax=Palleronia sp. THAF1 TaxID=2587842 RepID=UPI000F3D9FE8|nr:superoxide dismutase family protein [Palleronia sp. THAF1]QFU07758.1 Superoxide dismutase [Cu-Zn] precursor [Palleronia sp. THAF1]VDC25573.1 Superoxide dismutase [Cu-Zn] precursor [Rhodobacteraceae bacterium THAF1]
MFRSILTAASIGALTALPVMAEQHSNGDMAEIGDSGFVTAARAEVSDREGNSIGTVTINRTLSGTSLVIVALNGVPEGAHGIHLHETGDCSADDFTSAGGHIAGEAEHGVFAENGPHPGDLPNATVGSDGAMTVEAFNARLDIESMVFDDDGAAFIVHAGPDDYITQSAGDAGERIACGVFEPA